jgi:hypothetical protein
VAFTEFDRHPDIVSYDIFSDVVSRSQTYGGGRHSWMDSVRNEIASSLIRKFL